MSVHIKTSACSFASAPSRFGSGMDLLQVVADREALGQASAVVELENRHRRARILGEKRRVELGTRAQIDLDRRYLEALLGDEQAHLARARRQ